MPETKEIVFNLLEAKWYGNPLEKWMAALVLFVSLFILLESLKVFLIRRAKLYSGGRLKTFGQNLECLLKCTKPFFLLVVCLYLGLHLVILPPKTWDLTQKLAIIVLILQGIVWGNNLISFWVTGYVERQLTEEPEKATTVRTAGAIGKIALWVTLFLVALDNIGVNVTAFIAGLGIGGVAIALAAQKILEDLFASLSIILDKPFVLGDFIIVGTEMGTIEKIGLKTTRVRSLSGEQLIFSNADLLQSRIRNYKRMFERRIVFRFGVIYQTSVDHLKKIPEIVTGILSGIESARLERVHFAKFGDYSLDFEVVYWVKSPEYQDYMDIQQRINFELFAMLGGEGIKFAFPTRTLFVTHAGQSSNLPVEIVSSSLPGPSPAV